MMNKGLAATAAVALALVGGTALAGPEKWLDKWSKLDKDGDGKVAISDIDEKHRAVVARADADNDGFITKAELASMRAAKKAEWKAKRFPDTNKDGFVDRVEFDAAARERFAALDTSGDGRLSQEEMDAGDHRGRSQGGDLD